VSGRFVILEKLIVVLPLVWTFALNALPQPLQNLTVKLAIDGLTREYEFLVVSSLDVKKFNMDLTLLPTLRAFFGPGDLATSTATTAALSQSHNHTPMFQHWL
jgi:hypothetical protein